MKFEFIKQGTLEYQKAVKIRIKQFFEGMENALSLINDKFENNSLHLVCFNRNDDVIGTGRLHFVEKTGIISQMAIASGHQKKGVGKEILKQLMDRCYKEKVEKIELAARETALGFYRKFGFKTIGQMYASKKTGVIHQDMVKIS